jgi:hypothetical protein
MTMSECIRSSLKWGGGQISGAYRVRTGGPNSYRKSSNEIQKAHLQGLRGECSHGFVAAKRHTPGVRLLLSRPRTAERQPMAQGCSKARIAVSVDDPLQVRKVAQPEISFFNQNARNGLDASCPAIKSHSHNSKAFYSRPPIFCAARWTHPSSRNSFSGCSSSSASQTSLTAKREQLRKKDFVHITDASLLKELLEDKTSYGETFFVPVRARWHESWKDENGDEVPALKDLKQDIGNMFHAQTVKNVAFRLRNQSGPPHAV